MTIDRLSPLLTVGSPAIDDSAERSEWSVGAAGEGARGVMLHRRVVPRNGDQVDATVRWAGPAAAENEPDSADSGLVESSSV